MLKESDNFGEPVTDDSILLKWTLQCGEVVKRTGLKWLTVESSGGLM
jgi:hypothetical protein